MSTQPEQLPYNQYPGNGSTSVFIYSFLVTQNIDMTYSIRVFVQPASQNPTDDDIVPQGTAYTVQNVGNVSGGTITFQPGYIPAAGTVVTIELDIQYSIITNYVVPQNINGTNLDNDFLNLQRQIQQIAGYFNNQALHYAINADNPNPQESALLPLITNAPNQTWVSDSTGRIVAATLNPVDGTLASQLANQGNGTDGSRLIGLYDSVNNVSTTVHDFLQVTAQWIKNLINDIVPELPKTGDIAWYWSASSYKNGWIRMVNGTIGNASSGANIRANADMINLYTLFWNNCSNTDCPVSSGRGASAAADFSANKTLQIPYTEGRVILNKGNLTTLGQWDLSNGAIVGEAQHTQTEDELAPHTHDNVLHGASGSTGSPPYPSVLGHTGGPAGGDDAIQSLINVSAGNGNPMNIVQPSTCAYLWIKI